ncbi:serine hydrolase [Halomonas halocynthiae]|uniref:serine hydrolase n=1 Tax=Halomonas halocynthiae TaxID=176290 RepID=UPI000402B207|nr:serine hydrolase [Halomonas halocynthiae]
MKSVIARKRVAYWSRTTKRGVLALVLALGVGATGAWAQVVESPITAAQVKDAVDQLDGLVETAMTETGVPGLAVAVVYQGKILFAKGYGVREAGKPERIDADTVFQIASLSKPVSASVVAHQVGSGVVSWDDSVQQYLPWFQLQDSWVSEHVSIGDFFAHRSGLPDHAGDDLEDIGYGRQYILEHLKHLPLGAFRNTYAYTNFGLTAGAEAVATASGVDWASLAENTLYAPLGMASTSSRFDDFMAQDNRAVSHTIVGGMFEPIAQRMPDPQSPAGGVSTSVADFSRWMIMLLSQGRYDGKVIIEEEALTPALTPQVISRHPATPVESASFYGFGTNVATQASGRTMLSHSGAFTLGVGTNYMMLPSEELGIAVFTNAAPVGAAESITAQFMDLVQYGEVQREWLAGYQQLFAQMTSPLGELLGQQRPKNSEPSVDLELLEGEYDNAYFGPAKIQQNDATLVLTLGPNEQTFEVQHWAGDVFYFPVFTENMPSGSVSSLTFDVSGDGVVRSMTVEFLNEYGLAVFNRQGR